MKITLEGALKVAESLVALANVIGGGQPDRVAAALRKLKDVVAADWPKDAAVSWSAIDEHCDLIVVRGAAIGARIDAD